MQQQALRDFAQATSNFFAGTHRHRTWRKAGRHEGFRVTLDRAGRWHVAFAIVPPPINGEDLKITNMVRLARGTVETPGVKVRAKAGLNRSIHAAGWGRLVERLEDKVPGRVERVDPVFTSQTCHACGHREAKSRESQAVFRCRACGHADHAEVNAAENIAAGRAVTARGALQPLGGAVNREPQPVPTSG